MSQWRKVPKNGFFGLHCNRRNNNANRISRLLMGPCADQLKDLLCFYVPPSKFPEVIKKSRLPGFMSVNHRKLILPKSGAYKGDYGDMDITLLYTLLRNICGIKEHRAGWGEKPQASDRSVSANIERIRLARNQCSHSTGGLLSNMVVCQSVRYGPRSGTGERKQVWERGWLYPPRHNGPSERPAL